MTLDAKDLVIISTVLLAMKLLPVEESSDGSAYAGTVWLRGTLFTHLS